MNPSEAEPLPSDQSASDTGAEVPAEKPKRKRAPRKTAVAAEGALSSEGAEGAAPDAPLPTAAADAASEAPKRRRAPKAAVAAAEVDAGDSVAPALPATEGGAAVDAGARVEGIQDSEGGSEGGGSEGGDAAEGADQALGSRRSRNRRRGRRGGERGRDGAVEGAPGDPAAEAVGAPPAAAAPRAPAPVVEEVFAQVLSGEFDVEPLGEGLDGADAATGEAGTEGEAQAAPKRVLAAEADAPKLHKVLAQSGVGSRRDLEQMIAEGRVTVNEEVAHTGQRISFGDRINIDGKPVRYRIAPPPARVLAYHKPAGEVVTHDDPQQRPTVFRRLPRLAQGKWQSVGRLDLNTEGLLLFTNSGELANQLMHPRFGVEREYAVRSLGVLDQAAKARLLAGVEIDGQTAGFKSIEDGGGEGVNHWYRVVITEGRNREVRRLFEAVGHAVSRLIRIRYGSVVLPRGLKRGAWVDLDDFDLRNLRRLASPPRPEGAPAPTAAPVREPGAEGPGKRSRNRRGGKRRGDEGDRGPRPERIDGPPRADQLPRAEQAPRGDRPPRPDRGPNAERSERSDRHDAGPRPPRAPRQPREPRGPRPDAGEGGAIPNPLQQTFDKRAIQQERALRRDMPEDGPIPNPLQQTYDKRALQRDRMVQRDIPEDGPIPNPLQQTYDKRFASGTPGPKRGKPGGGPGGNNRSSGGRNGRATTKKSGGGGDPQRVPDPMQTAIGFIGADAFHRKNSGGGGRGGPRRGGGGGAGGGGNAGGGNRGGPRGGGGGGGGGNRGPR
jgi:23S rRNA pseudouridine2605 synthase